MFYDLGRWPLMDPDEGRNAEVAREMLASGGWAVPRLNGLPFLDKPPLLFWSIAGSFRLLGTSEAAARLPAALSGMTLVLLTFAMARILLGTRAALWAAAVVGTAPLVLVYARLTIFDMLFTALVTSALLCLVRTRLGGDAGLWFPLAGLAMGLAALTKGPVGVVLPLLTWGAARGALPPAPRPRGRVPLVSAVMVFLAVVLPWLVTVVRAEPDFLRYAAVDETLLRFVSTARFRRGEAFYYPMLVTAVGLGVWTAVLFGTVPLLGWRTAAATRHGIAARFAARAAATILLFFTISASKRPGYVIPALVPLAILVAVGMATATQRATNAVRMVALGAVSVGLVAIAVVWDPAAVGALRLGEVSGAVNPSLLAAVATFLLAWGAIVIVAGRVWPIAPLALAAAFGPGLYLTALNPLAPYAEQRSARFIARAVPSGVTVVSFRHFRPSLPFYLRRSVILATTDGHELSSNYVSSRHRRFLANGGLMSPAHARAKIREATSLYILTGGAWAATVRTFRPEPLTFVAGDRWSALWMVGD